MHSNYHSGIAQNKIQDPVLIIRYFNLAIRDYNKSYVHPSIIHNLKNNIKIKFFHPPPCIHPQQTTHPFTSAYSEVFSIQGMQIRTWGERGPYLRIYSDPSSQQEQELS